MKLRHAGIAAALAVAVTLSVGTMPTIARAADSEELQAQVDEALATLQSYTHDLEIASNQLYELNEQLNAIEAEIADTETEIAEKEQELADGQAKLGSRLAETYKQGGSMGILSVVLGTSSFDELVSTIFYADRMADYDAELLGQVVQAQQDLEEKRGQLEEERAQQEQLVADQEDTTAQIEAQVAEQQAYYEGLDSELQAQLEAEAEARRQAALEAAEQAAAEQAAEQERAEAESSDQESTDSSQDSGSSSSDQSSDSGGSDSGSPDSGSSGGNQNTNSGSAPSDVVGIALAQVGKGYVLGAGGPNSFDCSGLVTYCYGQLGYYLPHSSGALYNVVAGKGHLVSDSSLLSPGDLVFWGTGSGIYHVAIYIGGGQVVHATNPYYGVLVTGLYEWDSQYYVGGGSPV